MGRNTVGLDSKFYNPIQKLKFEGGLPLEILLDCNLFTLFESLDCNSGKTGADTNPGSSIQANGAKLGLNRRSPNQTLRVLCNIATYTWIIIRQYEKLMGYTESYDWNAPYKKNHFLPGEIFQFYYQDSLS